MRCPSGACALRPRQTSLTAPQLRSHGLHDRLQGLASNALQLRGGQTSSTLEALKVPLAFAGWYLMSIVYSVMNKEVLTVWKYPCVFSAVQLLVGSLFVAMLWTPLPTFGVRKARFAPLRTPPRLSWAQLATVSSVALWLALGHLLSTVAPAYGTVAFTNVVKTLEPLFTCLFSYFFLGQLFALPVYLSLLPVIGGVAVASANEARPRHRALPRTLWAPPAAAPSWLSLVCFLQPLTPAAFCRSFPTSRSAAHSSFFARPPLLAVTCRYLP